MTTENLSIWRDEKDRNPPPEKIVFLRPNQYDPNRANLVLIQPTKNAEEIPSDLSKFLKTGDRFRIQAAEDFFGPAVVEGEYAGGEFQVPVGGKEASAFVIMRTPGG